MLAEAITINSTTRIPRAEARIQPLSWKAFEKLTLKSSNWGLNGCSVDLMSHAVPANSISCKTTHDIAWTTATTHWRIQTQLLYKEVLKLTAFLLYACLRLQIKPVFHSVTVLKWSSYSKQITQQIRSLKSKRIKPRIVGQIHVDGKDWLQWPGLPDQGACEIHPNRLPLWISLSQCPMELAMGASKRAPLPVSQIHQFLDNRSTIIIDWDQVQKQRELQ